LPAGEKPPFTGCLVFRRLREKPNGTERLPGQASVRPRAAAVGRHGRRDSPSAGISPTLRQACTTGPIFPYVKPCQFPCEHRILCPRREGSHRTLRKGPSPAGMPRLPTETCGLCLPIGSASRRAADARPGDGVPARPVWMCAKTRIRAWRQVTDRQTSTLRP